MSTPFRIQTRAFDFSVAVTRACRAGWPRDIVTQRLCLQLLKAATSIGANLEEADAGQSKADFISKTAIARKEAREALYWLRLIAATAPNWRPELTTLLDEANQIVAILTAIKKKAESNPDRGP